MKGHVYILIHDRIPGLVKIGCTTCPVAERVAAINSASGVPPSFREFCSFSVEDSFAAESLVHTKLEDYRYAANREFFEIKPEVAREYVAKMLEGFDFGVKYDDPAAMTSCNSMDQLGGLIRRHRKLQGATQEDLAMVANCGLRFIIDVEAGKPTCQIGKVFDLLAALRVTLAVDAPGYNKHASMETPEVIPAETINQMETP